MKEPSGEVSDEVEAEKQKSKTVKILRTEQSCERYQKQHTATEERISDCPEGRSVISSLEFSPKVPNSEKVKRWQGGHTGQTEVNPHCQVVYKEGFSSAHMQPFGISGGDLADMATPQSESGQYQAGNNREAYKRSEEKERQKINFIDLDEAFSDEGEGE
eukprot:741681-Amphidinium_carterae.1